MAENRAYNKWWIAAATVLFCTPVVLYLFVGGWVSGREFSPDDFSRRSFSYNVMPFFNITVRGIEYHDDTPVFEQTLYADGFIGKGRKNQSWHLISDSASDQRSADFDARFLCRYLDLTGENNESIWISWNKNHPELAVIFWPIIADLAREYLYLDIAPVMLKAVSVSGDSVSEFEEYLEKAAGSAFAARARELQRENEYNRAVSLYTKAIEIRPTRKAYLARASCYRALGENALSSDDLEEANKAGDDESTPTENAANLSGQ